MTTFTATGPALTVSIDFTTEAARHAERAARHATAAQEAADATLAAAFDTASTCVARMAMDDASHARRCATMAQMDARRAVSRQHGGDYTGAAWAEQDAETSAKQARYDRTMAEWRRDRVLAAAAAAGAEAKTIPTDAPRP